MTLLILKYGDFLQKFQQNSKLPLKMVKSVVEHLTSHTPQNVRLPGICDFPPKCPIHAHHDMYIALIRVVKYLVATKVQH